MIFFVFAAKYAAIARVFLPNQVALLNPADKVANLALITSVTAVAIAIVTPLSGALSDRTRSRFGKRTPYILGGATIGCALVVMMPQASSLAMLLVLWATGAFFLNGMKAPLTTIIADRFPITNRGLASGCMGAGLTSGLTAGTIAAAILVGNLALGYTAFTAVLLGATILFVSLNREPSSIGEPLDPFSWRRFLSDFWVSPRRHPDFAWAFFGRFFMFMGYTGVVGYTLYTLRDYIHMDAAESNRQVAIIFTIELVTAIIAGLGSGWLSDRLQRRKPFVFLASFAIGLSFMVPVVMPSLTGMYVYAVILGIGYGAFTAVDMALMTQVLPKTAYESSGKNLGILSIAVTLPQIFGLSMAAAILIGSGNDYRILFGSGAFLVILSSFMVLPIRSVR
ncbi:MFS transporter [Sphingobium algorifonticola]|nr:MFS transporter [Sphingobium algorifonticola]